jgi:hypothetical protein
MSSAIFVLLLLFSICVGIRFVGQVKSQTNPTVSIMFSNGTNSSVGEYHTIFNNTFRVNIAVDSPDVAVWSWQAGIYFNNTVLECTSLGNGTFFAGKYTLGFQSGTVHNDLGYVTFSGSSLRLPETEGVKGSGILMWFEFHVKGLGPGFLNLTSSPPDLTCGVKLNERVDGDVVPIFPIALYNGWIFATKAGDLGTIAGGYYDFDYKCDYQDANLFRKAYVEMYHPLADFNRDHIVNYKDASLFRSYYIAG